MQNTLDNDNGVVGNVYTVYKSRENAKTADEFGTLDNANFKNNASWQLTSMTETTYTFETFTGVINAPTQLRSKITLNKSYFGPNKLFIFKLNAHFPLISGGRRRRRTKRRQTKKRQTKRRRRSYKK